MIPLPILPDMAFIGGEGRRAVGLRVGPLSCGWCLSGRRFGRATPPLCVERLFA